MKNVQISLPDDLAQDAERVGLLSGAALEQLLRQAVRGKRLTDLRSAMDRMAADDVGAAMSPEAVADEVAAFRAERRQAASRQAS